MSYFNLSDIVINNYIHIHILNCFLISYIRKNSWVSSTWGLANYSSRFLFFEIRTCLHTLRHFGSDRSCRDITIGHRTLPDMNARQTMSFEIFHIALMYRNFEIMLMEIVLIQFTSWGTFHINNGPHVEAGVLCKYHGISMTFRYMTGKTEQEPQNQIFMTVSEGYLSLLLFQWSLCNFLC